MQATSAQTTAILNALVRAWGHGDVDALNDVLAPGYRRYGRRSKYTREQIKTSIQEMRRAFPDLTMTIVRCVESDDQLATQWTSTGTLMDTYLGLPPTGRTFSVSGSTFSTLKDGWITEEWVVYDRRGEYGSLGVPLGAASEPELDSSDSHGLVDDELMRHVHRKLVTGVTVVATQGSDGVPHGLAVNAFSSVSLDPPQVLICVQKSSSTYSHLLAASHFGVSILAAEQLGVASVFATKQPDKFASVAWHAGPHGSPLIDDACASMEIELRDTLHASTHTIFIGRVVAAGHGMGSPLVYTEGKFFDGRQLIPVDAY